MKYFNDEELLNVIDEYINRKCRYAILIDGEWGCGKTNFVDTKLVPKLEKEEKQYVFVSLYGITKTKEIDQKITEKMLEKIPKVGSFLKIAYKNSGEIGQLIKFNFKDKDIRDLFKNTNLKEFVDKFTSIDDTIVILDDLERCTIPFNEILGYINEYVEHKKCKVIIVANQKEIAKSKNMQNMELKYLAVKSANSEYNIENEINENVPTISKIQLDRRVQSLFSEDLEYKQIKEKVIGRVFYYRPNLKKVLENVLNESCMEDTQKEFVLSYSKNIVKIMEAYNHINIRTLKFSIEILEKILPIVNKIKISPNQTKIFDVCKYDILMYTIYASILEKIGRKRIYWNSITEYQSIQLYGKENIEGFKFIDEYIDNGIVEEYRVIEILMVYLKEVEIMESDSKDPLYKLENLLELEDHDILVKLNELEKRLEKNKYKTEVYPKILKIIIELKFMGFPDDVYQRIVNIMERNIKNSKDKISFNEFGISFNTNEKIQEYNEISKKLKNLANISYTELKEDTIDNIMSSEDWGINISQYYLDYREKRYFENEFLKLFNIEKLIKNIVTYDSKNIRYFRRLLGDIYSYSDIKQQYKYDFENIKRLKNGIEQAVNDNSIEGLTKKCNIELLIKELEQIIEKFK